MKKLTIVRDAPWNFNEEAEFHDGQLWVVHALLCNVIFMMIKRSVYVLIIWRLSWNILLFSSYCLASCWKIVSLPRPWWWLWMVMCEVRRVFPARRVEGRLISWYTKSQELSPASLLLEEILQCPKWNWNRIKACSASTTNREPIDKPSSLFFL